MTRKSYIVTVELRESVDSEWTKKEYRYATVEDQIWYADYLASFYEEEIKLEHIVDFIVSY